MENKGKLKSGTVIPLFDGRLLIQTQKKIQKQGNIPFSPDRLEELGLQSKNFTRV